MRESLKEIEQKLQYTSKDESIDKANRKKTIGIYLECLKPSWKYVILQFFLILLDATFELMIPYLSGLLIRNGLEGYAALDALGNPSPIIYGGGINQEAMNAVWL